MFASINYVCQLTLILNYNIYYTFNMYYTCCLLRTYLYAQCEVIHVRDFYLLLNLVRD